MAETSWHSYPSIYALGHRNVSELFRDPVVIEEKIDGSQFSFGLFEGDEGRYLRVRSKGSELNMIAPEKMFSKAIDTVRSLRDTLMVGWTYRAEYLVKPKHNALAYDRIPKDHLIIFDINTGHEQYLGPTQKAEEAERIGLEVVPMVYEGMVTDEEVFRSYLDKESCLGGQKVEGVVVKNYHRFGADKKALLGKFVSEAFKETHNREWKAANPTKQDVVALLIQSLKTDARWHKAVHHLRDRGCLEDSPRDIGLLMQEIPADIMKEEEDFIKGKLFDWACPHIRRGVMSGLPEWYKEQLLKRQFSGDLG